MARGREGGAAGGARARGAKVGGAKVGGAKFGGAARPGAHRALLALRARALPSGRRGVLVAGALALPCALGRGGVVRAKREGDGGTPAGRHALGRLHLRLDRLPRPASRLPARAIRARDGWCDDPAHRAYNRPVRLPHPASHEVMARADGLYDRVVEIAWNRGPIRRGRGSAIFLHAARPGLPPTEGCIALEPGALRRLLPRLGPATRLVVG